jgi:hypothetical protein
VPFEVALLHLLLDIEHQSCRAANESTCAFQLFDPFILTSVSLLETERQETVLSLRARTAKIDHLHIYRVGGWAAGEKWGISSRKYRYLEHVLNGAGRGGIPPFWGQFLAMSWKLIQLRVK